MHQNPVRGTCGNPTSQSLAIFLRLFYSCVSHRPMSTWAKETRLTLPNLPRFDTHLPSFQFIPPHIKNSTVESKLPMGRCWSWGRCWRWCWGGWRFRWFFTLILTLILDFRSPFTPLILPAGRFGLFRLSSFVLRDHFAYIFWRRSYWCRRGGGWWYKRCTTKETIRMGVQVGRNLQRRGMISEMK